MALLELLAGSPALFIALFGAVGLLVGSFLNVVIHRLPMMMEREWRAECEQLRRDDEARAKGLDPATLEDAEPAAERFNLAVPRSRCPHCGNGISALDNIPVLSWLVLRGRCRHCKAPISARYPVIEAVAGAMGAIVAWHFGFGLAAPLAAGLSWTLLALAMIDFDTTLLPDALTQPLLWFGIAAGLFGVFVPLETAVIGAIAGYLMLWTVYWGFKLLTGKEGMGYGDFKLLAALGAWLGWPLLPSVILGAAGVGLVVVLTLVVLGKRDRKKPIPFGPYLAAAGWLALVAGDFATPLVRSGLGLLAPAGGGL